MLSELYEGGVTTIKMKIEARSDKKRGRNQKKYEVAINKVATPIMKIN